MNTLPRFDSLPLWEQYIVTAIKGLQRAAGLRPDYRDTFNTRAVLALRPSIPYVVHETPIEGVYILLNRAYKPLGLSPNEQVNYALYQHVHVMAAEVERMKGSFEYRQHRLGVEGRFFDDQSDPSQSKTKAAKLISRLIGLLATQHRVTARRVIESYGL
jgi:hypothetical protein